MRHPGRGKMMATQREETAVELLTSTALDEGE